MSEAGPQQLPEHWRNCRWLCPPGSGSALRWPAATPRRSGIHRAQLRRWIGSEPLTLSGVREPLLQGTAPGRCWDHRCRCKALAV